MQIKSIEKNKFFIFMHKFLNHNLSSNGNKQLSANIIGASLLVPRGYITYGVVFVQFHWLNQSLDKQKI